MPADAKALSPSELAADPATTKAAYDDTRPKRTTLAEERLQRVTVDIPRAAAAVLAGLVRVGAFMAVLRALPLVNVKLLDVVLPRTLALLHAENLLLVASGQPDRLKALLAEADPLRDLLRDTWALPLIGWKIFTQAQLDAWKDGAGHADLGSDLVSCGEAYLARWKQIAGKADVTEADCRRAVALGREILEAVGGKSNPDAVAKAALERRRAFTLLLEAWDELQRAVVFVRWHAGDADTLAPSLFTAGRRAPAPRTVPPATPAPTV